MPGLSQQAGSEGKSQEGIRMRPRILLTILLTALFVILSGCGTTPNCPTCGTTLNGAYAIINVIPVPEHNATGEPGGPFNSFDISWLPDSPSGGLSGTHNLDYISDRIGVAVQVIDTDQDICRESPFKAPMRSPARATAPAHAQRLCSLAHSSGERGSHSAHRGCIWQLHPVRMQNRYDRGKAGPHLPPHHGLWSPTTTLVASPARSAARPAPTA